MIQARLSAEEESFVKDYAAAKNMSLSELIRDSIFEKIENEIDLKAYEDAMKMHLKKPRAIGFDEMYKAVNG